MSNAGIVVKPPALVVSRASLLGYPRTGNEQALPLFARDFFPRDHSLKAIEGDRLRDFAIHPPLKRFAGSTIIIPCWSGLALETRGAGQRESIDPVPKSRQHPFGINLHPVRRPGGIRNFVKALTWLISLLQLALLLFVTSDDSASKKEVSMGCVSNQLHSAGGSYDDSPGQ